MQKFEKEISEMIMFCFRLSFEFLTMHTFQFWIFLVGFVVISGIFMEFSEMYNSSGSCDFENRRRSADAPVAMVDWNPA